MAEKIIPLQSFSADGAGVTVFAVPHPDYPPGSYQEVAVPHRHDHYSCFLMAQGAADVVVDFQPLHLTSGSLLVSLPGQVHRVGEAQQEFRGWIALADAKLISPAIRSRLEQGRARPELLHLTPDQQAWFQHVFEALHAATLPPPAPLAHPETSHHLLDACLAQAAHLLEAQQHQQQWAHSRRSLVLTQAFRQLVQQQFRTCKKPAVYADQLHVTVSHLNDTVKAATGFSVSYFIQQEVVAEAQRLLFYTDLNVQAVAGELGFDDARYFSRLFAKTAGVSPSEFRRQQQPTHTA